MKLLMFLIFFCNALFVKSSFDCTQADINENVTGMDFSGLNFSSLKNISKICLTVEPTKYFLFDTSFNLKGASLVKNISLRISNLKGFAMTNSFSLNEFKNGELSITNSSFDFFYANKTKFDNDLCKSVHEKEIFITAFNAFSRLDLNENVTFSNNTCPIHFKNAYLNQLSISKLNSNNTLGFVKLDYSSNSINSTIENLIISDSQFKLDDNLFDQEIFKKTKKISIDNSCLNYIKEDLFQNSFLNEIELKLNCFSDFIKNGTEWLKHLNSNNTLDILELKLTDLNSTYKYPEEDFCLFKSLPKRKGIVPVIQTKERLECSCTLLWFLSEKNESITEKLRTNSTKDCLDDSEFDIKVKKCNFEEKLQNCEQTTTSLETSTTTSAIENTTANVTISTTPINMTTEANRKDPNNVFEILMIVFIVLTIILIIILIVFYLKYKKSRSKEDRNSNNLDDSRVSVTQNGTKLYNI